MATVLCAQGSPTAAPSRTPVTQNSTWDSPHNGNPFIPGYFADPSVLHVGNEFYLYGTEDPWGQRNLGCWKSSDFVQWRTCNLNWPTKEAASDPTSNTNMVWAPSVIRGENGRFYMYVSVGSEVWVGVANAPEGPWRNPLGKKPLIAATFNRAFHMIDAEVFLDTDGQAYLYWGSGLNWVNGHCFAVRLKPDMISFDGEPQDVTPPHYFEAPFMYKRKGLYYLMYSEGKTLDETYKVRYSVGTSPFGPFREGVNSPILESHPGTKVLGPGHHAVFSLNGKTYIIYGRHSIPFNPNEIKRQLCIDELRFSPSGDIEKVIPTHTGAIPVPSRARDFGALHGRMTASSFRDEVHNPSKATDDNYATRWMPSLGDATPWLTTDFGGSRKLRRSELRFEYPWKRYCFKLLASSDGKKWTVVEDQTQHCATGSPVVFDRLPRARFLRIQFAGKEAEPSLFEWTTY